MRQIISFFIGFFLLVLTACSSDDAEVMQDPVVPQAQTISFFINEDAHNPSQDGPYGSKTEDMILISAENLKIAFNKWGALSFVQVAVTEHFPNGARVKNFYSSTNYSAYNFTFHMDALDEVNKRVKGSFAGFAYFDPVTLTLESKFISGSFDVNYIDVVAPIKYVRHDAKINNVDWHQTNRYFTNGAANDNNNVVMHDVSDNEFQIMVHYNLQTTQVGTYDFVDSDVSNKIQVAKYDSQTKTYTNYATSGKLKITQKEFVQGNTYIISATYTATGVNPNNSSDVIAVTDGTIKYVTFSHP